MQYYHHVIRDAEGKRLEEGKFKSLYRLEDDSADRIETHRYLAVKDIAMLYCTGNCVQANTQLIVCLHKPDHAHEGELIKEFDIFVDEDLEISVPAIEVKYE